jgi:hypothetical protein
MKGRVPVISYELGLLQNNWLLLSVTATRSIFGEGGCQMRDLAVPATSKPHTQYPAHRWALHVWLFFGISPGIMKATRALLDFTYIAQFPLHSDTSLNALQAALSMFHDNKNAFIVNGSRAGTSGPIDPMNIPKLHALHHYVMTIQDLGASDNY